MGEIGLCKSARGRQIDFDTQIRVFQEQLHLALVLKRSIIIHCVGYVGQLYEMLRSRYARADAGGLPPPPMILHSYSGSKEMMAAFGQLGGDVYFSFSVKQILSVKKAQDCVRHVDLDRLLVETDAPDQIPPGHAVELNEPKFVHDAVAYILALRVKDISSLTEMQHRLNRNVRRAFQLNDVLTAS